MTTSLDAIAFKSRTHPGHKFQNLYGLLDTNLLLQSWGQLNKQSAPGIDGVKASQYQQGLFENVSRLGMLLRSKRYRAAKVKRVLIPKGNGKMRPLGLPTLEDKVVQQSTSQILQSIWEPHFIRGSYGYRPNKSAHQAVKSLQLNLQYGSYGYLVEADIKGFFDHIDHDWLLEMLADKIEDKALLKLITQWLKAKVVEPSGQHIKPVAGSPQGGVISPVLANIYLHYALDIWFERKIKPTLQGLGMIIRYADDFVVAFQYKEEAEAFYKALPSRLQKFNLDVAKDKTHLKRISRFHPGRKRSFQFLGFNFFWEHDRSGESRLRCRTAPKKHKATQQKFYDWIKCNRSLRPRSFMPRLKRMLAGFNNYFGLPDNSRSVNAIYHFVLETLYKWLNRRSQRSSYSWQGLKDMLTWYNITPLRVRKRQIVVDWYHERAK